MKYHFIAIGGSVMHNLAIALFQKGHEVTGSDDEIFEPSKSRLKERGLLPEKTGWRPEMITNEMDAIILGMHAKDDNPELVRSKELGIPVYSFPEFLYKQTKNKQRIVIGGSHGKTTITSMVMHVLKNAEISFDYLVGAELEGFKVMVGLDYNSSIAVFEGDEYLTSPLDPRPKFHLYKPHIALISGIAWDHYNVFPTFENYVDQFRIFIDKIMPGGTLIVNQDDTYLEKITQNVRSDISVLKYGSHDHFINNGITSLINKGKKIPLNIFGTHNLENISAALLICRKLGISDDDFYGSMKSFRGAAKRLQLIKGDEDAAVFIDFAHAPSKVRATVNAVRLQFPDRKLVACLELHTYSSLNKKFIENYSGVLSEVDQPVVYFNPHALSLKRLPELSGKDIKKAFKCERLKVFSDSETLWHHLLEMQWQKSNLLLMSSGNFNGFNFTDLADKILLNKNKP